MATLAFKHKINKQINSIMYIPKNAFYNPNFNPYKISCEQQICDGLDAYVDCIPNILQGRGGCAEIHLIDKAGIPLDLSLVKSIEVIVMNSLGLYVDTWGWVKDQIQTSDSNLLYVYQRPISDINSDGWVVYDENSGSGGEISPDETLTDIGLIGIVFSPDHTFTPTGPFTAQIIVTMEGSSCNTYVIPCVVVANIVKNAILTKCLDENENIEPLIYRNLNKIIVSVHIQNIPLKEIIHKVKDIEEITEIGYYRINNNYYKCDYYSSEYDKNGWVIYN